jgi:hypothetical protein
MDDVAMKDDARVGQGWPFQIYKMLKEFGVAQISYVPDAGHSQLIELSHGDRAIQTTVLTTEEEGVALSAGLRAVTEITDIKGITDFRRKLQSMDDGPRLARIRIASGHLERALPPRDGVFLKNRFRENLGLPVT